MVEIVLGPPGTGKTTALLEEVDAALARGISPDRVGYVSFTRRAAQEAVVRASEKFGLDRDSLRYFRTLHSLCYRALGLSPTDVFEGRKVVEFGDWLGVKMSPSLSWTPEEGVDRGSLPGDRAMFMENLSRVLRVPLRQLYCHDTDSLPWSLVERVARGLLQYKQDHALLDYTDMLIQFADHGIRPDLAELYVDECQDLSMAQWEVIRRLAVGCERVVMAGDDDQAIYRWAGAAVEYFVDMPGEVRVLQQSWRCPVAVQGIAQDVVGRIRRRRPKEWLPRPAEGIVERAVSFRDADTSGDDVLVLVRNSFAAESILKQLVNDHVVHEWRGRSSVRESTMRAILVWERLRRGEAADVEEVRAVYAAMTAGVGYARGHKLLPGVPDGTELTMRELREAHGLLQEDIWHRALDRVPGEERDFLLGALQKGEKLRARPRVRVSTIHGSKGGEADHVVIVTDMARRTHQEMNSGPQGREDEARVWYVAATRARERLTIVRPQLTTRYSYRI